MNKYRIYIKTASKVLGFSRDFFISLSIKYLVCMYKISRMKNKIPKKYLLTLKQVFITDLCVRLGFVRCSLDKSFLKYYKSRLLLITTGFLRDIRNWCHGHSCLKLVHIDCDGALVAAENKDEYPIRDEVF
jgi:hypothetical protein